MTCLADPPAQFDWRRHATRWPERLLDESPEFRREVTARDPLMFGLVYFPHHLRSAETGNQVSLSQFHIDLAESAKQWMRDDLGPAELREAWVAPRGSGKSTWIFGILPAWSLAHGHRRFVAAFADSGHQAQQHLASWKRELETNDRLRRDFPDLCTAAQRSKGSSVADNQMLYVARSGAVFQAKGIDSSTLGAKVGTQRPDLLLFDDVEPEASNYSSHQKDKRQDTIVSAVFPMSLNAVVLFAGTTTMPGSVMHDIVKQVIAPDAAPDWVREENIRARHYPAIVRGEDGSERSLWPQRWSLNFLQSIRHTRSYALNYDNDPMAYADGQYWSRGDFRYGEVDGCTRTLIEVDPAVTTTGRSDFTGIVVASCSPSVGKVVIRHASGVRLTGGPLRDHVAGLLARYPQVRAIRVEVNQGGDLWKDVFAGLPDVRVLVHTVSASKEVRMAAALEHYQRGRVHHERPLPALEEQQVGFPNTAHDDIADAAAAAVSFFLAPARGPAGPKERTRN